MTQPDRCSPDDRNGPDDGGTVFDDREYRLLVRMVGHDLRTPLQVAEAHLDMAREECQSDHLDTVSDALGRIDELVANLVDLAREDDVLAVEPVALDAACADCWETVPTAEASLVVETAQTIRADASRLSRLLENLYRNAVTHAGDDATVTVGALDDGDGFYVADDGPGIPTGERPRVFESGHTTAAQGEGLGLFIVAEIARAHGWTLRLTDAADGGTRFEVADVAVVEEAS